MSLAKTGRPVLNTCALSASTGQILWTSPSETDAQQPPVIAQGHLIVGSVVYGLP